MIRSSYMFKKVTIIGVGLIGGSIGKALKERKLAREVVGVSHRQGTLTQAVRHKAIDASFTDIPKAVQGADLVILATPVKAIIRLLPLINSHLKRTCIITDVGSAKVEIVEAAEKNLAFPGSFIGSHPLAGSEKKGMPHARANLFDGSTCVITPTEQTSKMVVEKIKQFWAKLGANVKTLTCQEHDQILAYTSHLPHLLMYGFMEALPEKALPYGSKGLWDTTRIAGSSPLMWNDIFMANSKNVLLALDEYVAQLSALRQLIIDEEQKKLIHYFSKAKKKRDSL